MLAELSKSCGDIEKDRNAGTNSPNEKMGRKKID
jgi:hypothetical protein